MVDWAGLYGETPAEPEFRHIAVIGGSPRAETKAREIADAIGCYVKPLPVDALDSEKPELILTSDRAAFEALVRWAQKRSLPVIGPCTDVSVDPATREAVGRRPIMDGAMIAEFTTGGKRPQIFFLE
jgi:electron transfer flavoprotein alpha subunit